MGGVVQSVEHAGQNLINSVSNVGVGIDKGVRNTVPGGWGTLAATAAAIATANPELIGLSSGTSIAPEVIAAANATEDPIATLAASQGWTPAQTAAIESAATTAGTDISSNSVTQQMLDFANARPDPIQAMSELQNMTPTELATALGPGAGAAAVGGLGATGNALTTLAAVKALGGGASTTPSGGITTPTSPANPILTLGAPATTSTGIAQLPLPNFPQINPIANPTLAQVTPTNIPNAMNSAAPVAMPVSDQYINQYLANQQIQSEFPQMGKPLGTAKVAAEGGIMQSYAVGGPIMQASNLGSVGGNPMYPQANYNTNTTLNNPNNMPLSTNMIGGTNAPSSNPINMPVATNMLGGVGDSAVDPYTGEMRLAAGGPIAFSGKDGSEVEDDTKFNINAMSASKGKSPYQIDDRPISTLQAAMIRAQLEKQLGDAQLRAGISGMVGAMPGQQGVSVMPGAYDVGYNTPVGPGNLDISAYRAMKSMPTGSTPTGAMARYSVPFVEGGGIAMAGGGASNLGSYSDGGRLLKGPGDGMSDNIPASIANKQPARLADGEFVVPADVVSHLGNGSTDAGAKQLYAMMDRIRKARTGRKAQGKQIKAQKYLPK